MLRRAVGAQADWLRQLAWGHDPRPVEPDRPRKSIGSETTFPEDLRDLEVIRRQVARLAGHCARWLQGHQHFARTVTVKVRYADFTTIVRSHTDADPVADTAALESRAVALLDRTEAGRRPVRLLGVSAHNLTTEPIAPRRRHVALPRLPFAEAENGSS
jgi:DNA polymerase-4